MLNMVLPIDYYCCTCWLCAYIFMFLFFFFSFAGGAWYVCSIRYATFSALAGVDPTDAKAASNKGIPAIDSVNLWGAISSGSPTNRTTIVLSVANGDQWDDVEGGADTDEAMIVWYVCMPFMHPSSSPARSLSLSLPLPLSLSLPPSLSVPRFSSLCTFLFLLHRLYSTLYSATSATSSSATSSSSSSYNPYSSSSSSSPSSFNWCTDRHDRPYKYISGKQKGMGVWTGKVHPNSTARLTVREVPISVRSKSHSTSWNLC